MLVFLIILKHVDMRIIYASSGQKVVSSYFCFFILFYLFIISVRTSFYFCIFSAPRLLFKKLTRTGMQKSVQLHLKCFASLRKKKQAENSL